MLTIFYILSEFFVGYPSCLVRHKEPVVDFGPSNPVVHSNNPHLAGHDQT